MAKTKLSLSDFDVDNAAPLVTNEPEKEEVDTEVTDKEKQEPEKEPEKEEQIQNKDKKTKPDPIKTTPKEQPKKEPELEPEKEEEEEEIPDASQFFEEVEKLTGQQLDVDYGNIDPLSPQGVALREKIVREDALDTFLTEIEEKFPQVYKALQHAHNGGDISELFTQTAGRDYTNITLADDNEVLAKEILRDYYKSKGVKNDAKITKMIEADEDSQGGLVAEARTALEELKAEQEEQRNTVLDRQKQEAENQKKRDQILVTAIDETIEARNLGSFKIPDRAEAVEFKKFLIGNIRRTEDGKYELATPIDQANMEKILQYQYFQFKKGDLTKIISQKATTENANKLRLRIKSENGKVKSSTEAETTKKSGSLKDYDVA